jgi:hypothetical protein
MGGRGRSLSLVSGRFPSGLCSYGLSVSQLCLMTCFVFVFGSGPLGVCRGGSGHVPLDIEGFEPVPARIPGLLYIACCFMNPKHSLVLHTSFAVGLLRCP